MTPDHARKVQPIFNEAIKKKSGQVAAYLDEACEGDDEVRAEVESLLAAHREMPTIPGTAAECSIDEPANGKTPDLVGVRVDEYVVESRIGSGGMGVVYKAMQDRPKRLVALKTMKPGFDLERFEVEWQTLGSLQHTGIAHVYDVGEYEHESGIIRYFAMEYISSARYLTHHAEEFDFTIPERLRLFAQVCDAVAAAHHKGIVHLDLKPGNILVNAHDQPKIIDFGVASAARSGPLHASYGTRVYMSPEQQSGDPEDLDTRSDVYSLGVILFELLCGQLPHEVGAGGTVAAKPRRVSTVNPGVSPDIDAIITKATRKRRKRRYHTAADLADAVRQYLDGGETAARAVEPGRSAGRHRRTGGSRLRRFVSVVVVLAVLGLGALIPVLRWVRQGNDVVTATVPDPTVVLTPPKEPALIPLVDVETRAQWFRSHLRPIEPPDRPSRDHDLAISLRADQPGDLLLFEMGPDGATKFRSVYYEGSCEPLGNAEAGAEVAVPATFRLAGRTTGLHAFVAVLVAAASDALCEQIGEALAREPVFAETGAPEWPDDTLTATIRSEIEDALRTQTEAVLGLGIYLFPVMGD